MSAFVKENWFVTVVGKTNYTLVQFLPPINKLAHDLLIMEMEQLFLVAQMHYRRKITN